MQKQTKLNIIYTAAGLLMLFAIIFLAGLNIDNRRLLRETERRMQEIEQQYKEQFTLDSITIESMMMEIENMK